MQVRFVENDAKPSASLVTQAIIMSFACALRARDPVSQLVLLLEAPAPRSHAARLSLALFALGVTLAALGPALWTLQFAFASAQRIVMLAYWVGVLALGLVAMARIGALESVPQIIVRKGYHIIALLLFLPALALEPELLAVALAVAFAGLLALEAVRVGGVPRLSKALTGFMTAFTDARDGGVLFITHLALLVGMAAPIWVAVLSRQGTVDPSGAALAGLLILGLGDTAASVVGRLWGRHRIARGSPKTLEGLLAGALGTLVGWAACAALWPSTRAALLTVPPVNGGIVAATLLSSLLESVTSQLDNAVLPPHYLAMLSCLA
ncbi:hypothetical protein QBZ16_004513 [Prototheca wickerhamii]|uniref:dolichol kinase n=1 Tax=Prototheca wickerhamii TaxID=3111 RepID=A0AAD9IKI1_PROWI|nr:hypothetical protein QBZ16_004513 [Prototheca wickerhamii]